jgi:hypothetical protein
MPRDQAAVAAAVTSAARNVGIVLGIAVLGTIVNGRVPTMLTRTSGVSQAAFASFQHRYVDALHVGYVVAALVIAAASLMAAVTMRPSPPRSL